MLLGIPDATLAAIVTILSGLMGWLIKEYKDKCDRTKHKKVGVSVRHSDEYDFADRLKNEILRLQGLLKDAYADMKNLDTEGDLLRAENLKLIGELYESQREILRLNHEATQLSNQIDRLRQNSAD